MKTGLALGSGAARGLTHIGVLKAIEKKNIKIDCISGSSIGALIGGAYAMGMSLQEIEKIALKTDWRLMAKVFSPTLSFSALTNDRYLNEFLYGVFGDKTFDDLKIPLSVIAADIASGKMVVINSGRILKAIRASISIPIIFSPVSYESHHLVDGGLVNPTPVDVARTMGADKIIAVNLRAFNPHQAVFNNKENKVKRDDTSPIDNLTLNEKIRYFAKNPLKIIDNISVDSKRDLPGFGKILYQMFAIVQIQMADLTMQIATPDVLIEPDTTKYTLFDFLKGKELIEIGYQSAIESFKNNLPETTLKLAKNIKTSSKKSLLTHFVKGTIIIELRESDRGIEKVSEIIEDLVQIALELSYHNLEYVEDIVLDIFDGSSQAAKELGVDFGNFMDNALLGIKNGLKEVEENDATSAYEFLERLSELIKQGSEKSFEIIQNEIEKNRKIT